MVKYKLEDVEKLVAMLMDDGSFPGRNRCPGSPALGDEEGGMMAEPWELTDSEIQEANKEIYGDIEVLNMPQPEDRIIAKAAQRKLVEWEDGPCSDSWHSPGMKLRRNCPECRQALCETLGVKDG